MSAPTVKGGSAAGKAVPHLADEISRESFFEGVAPYTEAINDILSERVYEVTGQSRSLLEDLELDDPDREAYGCGAWGCAFPTLDPRWTVKISGDPREGPTVGAVFENPKLRDHPGNAYILGIWQLPPVTVRMAGFDNTPFVPWVILREDVMPWWNVMRESGDIDEDGNITDEAVAAFSSTLRLGKDAGTIFNLRMKERKYDEAKAAIELYFHVLNLLESVPESEELSDFLDWFYKSYNRTLADVHAGNIGYRQYDYSDVVANHKPNPPTLSVFDLGHSDTAVGAEIPFIKNPDIRRRIPVIR